MMLGGPQLAGGIQLLILRVDNNQVSGVVTRIDVGITMRRKH